MELPTRFYSVIKKRDRFGSIIRVNLHWKNALILICIVYTLLTVTSSGYELIVGETTDTHVHLLSRFLVTSIGIGSILIFNLFPHWSLLGIFTLHYGVTMSSIFLLVWVSGFFIQLHPDAFRDIFLNFTAIYILIAAAFQIRGIFKRRSTP